jgi:hypothetical protein
VSATANQPDPHTIIVTYQGGQDAGSLVGMTATVTDSKGQAQTKSIGSENGTIPLNAGEELSFDGAYAGKDHVVVTGHFSNGQDLVILDLTWV